jgi:hypothetical protein
MVKYVWAVRNSGSMGEDHDGAWGNFQDIASSLFGIDQASNEDDQPEPSVYHVKCFKKTRFVNN